MNTFVINGGNQLGGTIAVGGAKNHALKLIPASFLIDGETVIERVPAIEDVTRFVEIIEAIGGSVNYEEGTLRITPPQSFDGELPRELVATMRASIVMIGPLLARYGRVALPHPGGDRIGKRPINFFVQSMEALGATVTEDADGYVFEAPQGLTGVEYMFPGISVTGTETLMMAATLANGTTKIHNAAMEPEIKELADFLNAQGAQIEGAGTPHITITGGGLLAPGTTRVMPDRIEAGSFAFLAAAAKAELTITDCRTSDMEIPLLMLRNMGVAVSHTADTITVKPTEDIKPVNIVTHEYPGFPTDMQAPMTLLLTQAKGDSEVRETIFDGRLYYTEVLNTMGANIQLLDPYRAIVHGPTSLHGQEIESPDVRAGIAMVMAGLIAEGQTIIHNVYHIDRGYEHIEQRLQQINADITRVD